MPNQNRPKVQLRMAGADGREIDPVCGMTVVPPTAAGSVEHAGRTYHFCAASCRQAFAGKRIDAAPPPDAVHEAVVACVRRRLGLV